MVRELFDTIAFERHCPELVEIANDLADALTEEDAQRLRIEAQTARQLRAYVQMEHGYGMYEQAAGKFELHGRFTEYVLHKCVMRGNNLSGELERMSQSHPTEG